MEQQRPTLPLLFFTFFKIGLFTIGGGYAMLPLIRKEIVEKRQWATDEEILNYYGIGQSTPGIIAVNTATFIGVHHYGFIGGIVATLGMVTPSWIIIISIAKFMGAFQENIYIAQAFVGIRLMVLALIARTLLKMGKNLLCSMWDYGLMFWGFVGLFFLQMTPIYVLLLAGTIGVLRQSRKKTWKAEEGRND